ncbi:hypothetical protein F5883DRAFT_442043 [Diaporthe sp. PMI_573]|nr:hypothetical protein F5883DRAFT_442043 [Diaporthaceae sp. PMI_573]
MAWKEDLRNCVEKAEVPAQDDSYSVEKVRHRFNRGNCDSIRLSLDSLHRAVESSTTCGSVFAHEASIDLNWIDPNVSASKSFSLALLHRTDAHPDKGSQSWRRFHASNLLNAQNSTRASDIPASTSSVRLKLLRTPSPFHKTQLSQRSQRSQTPQTPSPPCKYRQPDSPVPTKTWIKKLCAELEKPGTNDEAFGSLPASLELNDVEFMLKRASKKSPAIVRTIPLKKLLANQDSHIGPHSYPRFSAKERYRMAASIAWAVLHLGGSRWLGELWDTDQLKVFHEKSTVSQTMLSNTPCTSYVISDAPGAELACEDIVRQSIPNRTICALGILLVELGTNQAFGADSVESIVAAETSELRTRLDEVYREAGDSYGYAAQRCVKCDFQGQNSQIDFNAPKFRQQFYDSVVAPIQATYEVFATSYNMLHL